MIPIGFYRPDLAETTKGIAGLLSNVIVRSDPELGVCYGPQAGAAVLATADALPEAPRGVVSTVTRGGVYKTFAGTSTKLYEVSADGSVTEIGSGYNLSAGDNWSMCQFGDYVYFSNSTDGVQRYSLESGGAVSAVAGAPLARIIFPLFGCLAALDCDGNNRLMKTSKQNDPTVWTGDASNRYQEFPEGEELMGGGEIGMNYAVVLQRNAIRILTRVPDRRIFSAALLATNVGTQSTDACCIAKGWCYFMDTDGPQRTNGQVIEPIGKRKVARTMIQTIISGGLTSVQVAYDPEENRVLYRYRAAGVASETVFEDILAFYPDIDGEWAPLAIDTMAIVALAQAGYTLEELDAFGNLDTLAHSLDSRVWKGGEPRIGIFDASGKFAFLTGDNLAAILETGTQSSGRSNRVSGATPYTDCEDVTVQLAVKRRITNDFTYGNAVSVDDDDFAPVDETGKYFRLRMNMAEGAEWDFARGFDHVEGARGGAR